jgi:hypothetical protein
MKYPRRMTTLLAVLLIGSAAFSGGCSTQYRDLIWPSIRDGLFTYVRGSVTSGLDYTMMGDFIIDSIIGDVTPQE